MIKRKKVLTRKIKEELTIDETFRIYQKWVFSGSVRGYRIPIRFNWDNPPKNSLRGFQRYLH